MHPDYARAERRAALFRLLGHCWPRLPERVATAAALGWSWDEVSTPFAVREGDAALAHVGVLDLDVLLGGAERRIAGLHAVCTHPDHRGRGHFRSVMERALSWVDTRFETAKLSTSQPELYERFGFRVVPQHRFRIDLGGDGGGARPADARTVRDLLARRAPASRVFAARDPGWLFGIDEVLWSGGLGNLWDVDGAVVAWSCDDGVLNVYDLLAAELPGLADAVARAPWPFREVVLWLTPDLVAPGAVPIPWPADDFLMVRGPWPIDAPHAVPPHARH